MNSRIMELFVKWADVIAVQGVPSFYRIRYNTSNCRIMELFAAKWADVIAVQGIPNFYRIRYNT